MKLTIIWRFQMGLKMAIIFSFFQRVLTKEREHAHRLSYLISVKLRLAARPRHYFNISARCAERNFSPGWNSPCNRALRMSKIDVFFFLGREKQPNFQPVNQKCAISPNTVRFFNKKERFELQIIFDTAGRIGESKPMTTPFWPHVYFFSALSIVVTVGNKMHMQRCKLHKLNRHSFLSLFQALGIFSRTKVENIAKDSGLEAE